MFSRGSGFLGESPDILRNYTQALGRHRSSSNGVVGAKLHFSHWRDELGLCGLDDYLPSISFIRITRRDKVRQAVSLSRAWQTNQYRHSPGSADTAAYSFEHVSSCLRHIHEEENGWDQFFRSRGIDPVDVNYEALDEEYVGTIAETVQQICGVNVLSSEISPAGLKKQADEKTERWVERFHRDLLTLG